MGRLRDHHPRFDATVCPDPAACDRLYHGHLEHGDICECCGTTVVDDTLPQGDDLVAVLRTRHAQRLAERKRIQADIDDIEKQLVNLGVRYAAVEDDRHGWIVRDTIKGGFLGTAHDPKGKQVRVPGNITEAEARAYADRLNGKG